ncbi:rRNA maturation RNase YbeY [Patescibacteria group bacterium]
MITIELNQQLLRGGQRVPKKRIKQVAKKAAEVMELKKEVLVSVAFVSKKEIKQLNKVYRGKDELTDVLSFSLAEAETLGEILINYDQAQKQAQAQKHSTRNEIVFLLVHGLVHLFGYDHVKDVDKKKMFALQNKILIKLNINPTL